MFTKRQRTTQFFTLQTYNLKCLLFGIMTQANDIQMREFGC